MGAPGSVPDQKLYANNVSFLKAMSRLSLAKGRANVLLYAINQPTVGLISVRHAELAPFSTSSSGYGAPRGRPRLSDQSRAKAEEQPNPAPKARGRPPLPVKNTGKVDERKSPAPKSSKVALAGKEKKRPEKSLAPEGKSTKQRSGPKPFKVGGLSPPVTESDITFPAHDNLDSLLDAHLPLSLRRQFDAGLLAGCTLARVDGAFVHPSKREFAVPAALGREVKRVDGLVSSGDRLGWVQGVTYGHPEAAAWVAAMYDLRIALGVLRSDALCEEKRLAMPAALARIAGQGAEKLELPPPPAPRPTDPLPRREIAEAAAAAARTGASLGDALLRLVLPDDASARDAAAATLRREAAAAAYLLLHVSYRLAPPSGAAPSHYALPERVRTFIAGASRLVASAGPVASLSDLLGSPERIGEVNKLYSSLTARPLTHAQAAPLFEPFLAAFLGDSALLSTRMMTVLQDAEAAARGNVAVAAASAFTGKVLLRGGVKQLDEGELRLMAGALGSLSKTSRAARGGEAVYRPDAWVHLPAALGLPPSLVRQLLPRELTSADGAGSPVASAQRSASPFLRRYLTVRGSVLGLAKEHLGMGATATDAPPAAPGLGPAAPPAAAAAAGLKPGDVLLRQWRWVAADVLTLARQLLAQHAAALPAEEAASSAAQQAPAAATLEPRASPGAGAAVSSRDDPRTEEVVDSTAAPVQATLAPGAPFTARDLLWLPPGTQPSTRAGVDMAVGALEALCIPAEIAALQRVHASMHALVSTPPAGAAAGAEWQDLRQGARNLLLATPEGHRLLGEALGTLRGRVRLEAYPHLRQLAILTPADYTRRFGDRLRAAADEAEDRAPAPAATYPPTGFSDRAPAEGDGPSFAQRLVRILTPDDYRKLTKLLAAHEGTLAHRKPAGLALEWQRRYTLAKAQGVFGVLGMRLDGPFSALLWQEGALTSPMLKAARARAEDFDRSFAEKFDRARTDARVALAVAGASDLRLEDDVELVLGAASIGSGGSGSSVETGAGPLGESAEGGVPSAADEEPQVNGEAPATEEDERTGGNGSLVTMLPTRFRLHGERTEAAPPHPHSLCDPHAAPAPPLSLSSPLARHKLRYHDRELASPSQIEAEVGSGDWRTWNVPEVAGNKVFLHRVPPDMSREAVARAFDHVLRNHYRRQAERARHAEEDVSAEPAPAPTGSATDHVAPTDAVALCGDAPVVPVDAAAGSAPPPPAPSSHVLRVELWRERFQLQLVRYDEMEELRARKLQWKLSNKGSGKATEELGDGGMEAADEGVEHSPPLEAAPGDSDHAADSSAFGSYEEPLASSHGASSGREGLLRPLLPAAHASPVASAAGQLGARLFSTLARRPFGSLLPRGLAARSSPLLWAAATAHQPAAPFASVGKGRKGVAPRSADKSSVGDYPLPEKPHKPRGPGPARPPGAPLDMAAIRKASGRFGVHAFMERKRREFEDAAPITGFVYFASPEDVAFMTQDAVALFGIVLDGANPVKTSRAGERRTLLVHCPSLRGLTSEGAAEVLSCVLEGAGLRVSASDTASKRLGLTNNGEVLLEFQTHTDAVVAAHELRNARVPLPAAVKGGSHGGLTDERVLVGWATREDWRKARPRVHSTF